jgi:hypothetical protein
METGQTTAPGMNVPTAWQQFARSLARASRRPWTIFLLPRTVRRLWFSLPGPSPSWVLLLAEVLLLHGMRAKGSGPGARRLRVLVLSRAHLSVLSVWRRLVQGGRFLLLSNAAHFFQSPPLSCCNLDYFIFKHASFYSRFYNLATQFLKTY